jgi:ABC-type glycerol-3-phosphate transport system substrate-binding protein
MKRVIRSFAMLVAGGLLLAACSSSGGGSAYKGATGAKTKTTVCSIPQNNGGDHDADNNGAPSDGDGCDI